MNQRATFSCFYFSASGWPRGLTQKRGGLISYVCWTWLTAVLLFLWIPISLGAKVIAGSSLPNSLPPAGEELFVVCPQGADLDDNGIPDGLQFSTGPFNCAAVVNPPSPDIQGGCAPFSWSFELWGTVVNPLTGNQEYKLIGRSSEHILAGVAPGLYDLRYVVKDNCGQEAVEFCSAVVVDAIDPVAICRQDIKVAADDQPIDSKGIAVLAAAELDGGSHDNCAVTRRLARREIEPSCLESFTLVVWEKRWPADFTEIAGTAGTSHSYFLAGGDTLLVLEEGIYYSWWDEELRFTCCDGGETGDGQIAVELKVLDGAGNSATCRSLVSFRGGGPALSFSCIQGVVLPLAGIDADGDGQWEDALAIVEAAELLSVPAWTCNGEVTYAINRVGETPDPLQAFLEFTCADPRSSPINVEVHAWDQAGNHSMCETFVVLRDDEDLCQAVGKNSSIAGVISTEKGLPVPEVKVTLSGGKSGITLTQSGGDYNFSNLDGGKSYEIRPSKEGDYLNGVTTYDLVLISKHIQGLLPLESPYLLIAADLNNSGTITTLDMIQLRQMVLSVDTEFRNNASWRFIDAAYQFPDPTNPWAEPFPESITVDELNGRQDDHHFVAVKIGDVNGNVVPRTLLEPEVRTEGTLILTVSDQELEAGQELRLELASPQLPDLEGLQFTLDYDPVALELLEVLPGQADRQDFASFPARGQITSAWSPYFHFQELPADPETYAVLVFKAHSSGRLSERLQISSRLTRAEAYGPGGEIMGVALNFVGSKPAVQQATLGQNRPNPFRTHTVVPFWLPENGKVAFQIFNAWGQIIRQFEREASSGYNELEISSLELDGKGVWFLTMETSGGVHTIKMVQD